MCECLHCKFYNRHEVPFFACLDSYAIQPILVVIESFEVIVQLWCYTVIATKTTELWKLDTENLSYYHTQKYMLRHLFVSEYIKGSEQRQKLACQSDVFGCGSKTNCQHLSTVR